jgi:hypothetical protein
MSGDSPEFQEFAAKSQPLPTGNGIDVAVEVARDMRGWGHAQIADDIEARIRMGEKKYGTRLKTHNGRNAMLDLYQEALDALNYAKQLQLENEETDEFSVDVYRRFAALATEIEARLKRS